MDYGEQERFRMVWGNSAVPLIHRQQATPTNYVLAKAR